MIMASRRSQHFLLISIAAAALSALIMLGDGGAPTGLLRLLLGTLFVLVVPGYCLAAALFPRFDDLDPIERLGLSLGLSVAVTPLLALVLNALPGGLQLCSILLGEYALAAAGAAISLVRRPVLPPPGPGNERHSPQSWWRSLPAREQQIHAALALALTLAVVLTAWIFVVPSPNDYMTEFYILGRGGLAEDYPRLATVNQELTARLGIANHELGEHSYRVEVWALDPWQAERRALVQQLEPVRLQPGQKRMLAVTWHMPWAGVDQQVEFLLFTDVSTVPYRRLRLWLDVAETEARP
jgi:uncharacterized membrane protein